LKLPIRITVTGLFLILSVLIMLVMFYIQSMIGKDLARSTMNDYFKIISTEIEHNIDSINIESNTLVQTNASYLKNITYEDFYKNKNKYLEYFTSQLEHTEGFYSMYIGFKENQFYEIIKLDIDENLRKKYNAKMDDKWLLVDIDKNFNETLSLFDKNLKRTSFKITRSDYLVSQRPWYKSSINKNKITKIGPYAFASIHSKGLTYSVDLGNENVFALDVLHNDFSQIVNSQNSIKSLESFVFTENFDSIVFNKNKDFIHLEILRDLHNKDLSQKIENVKVIDGKEYLYTVSLLDTDYTLKEYLVSYVLLDKMIAPFMTKFQKIDTIMIVLFFILLPIIWYLASIIVKPILLLAKVSEKVQNREFGKIVPVDGFVYEIDLLSKAFGSMAQSIDLYQTDLEKIVEKRTKELENKNKELQLLSVTDKLTNIYNRIMLDKTIDDEITKSKASKTQFGIILIDIDYFKNVNDTHGHQVGDMVLVAFSNILKENIRDIDLLGRWGGEEFLIVCSDSSLSKILSLAEQLRISIEKYNFPVITNKTASFGVSTYIENDTAETIIGRADEALYKAKEEGRNRVETIELNYN